MSLVLDRRLERAGAPGLHAFLVGVSAYPFLPKPQEGAQPNSFGMRQLSATALTAYRVYEWLLEADRQQLLPQPLTTIRLLLSPSAVELNAEPGLGQLAATVEPATVAHFLREARQWRTEAATNPEHVTFFYFAGHGIQRSKSDSVLLLEEFGDPASPVALENAVDIQNLFHGMAPAATRPEMARTQFYFVDACRNHPKQIDGFERMGTRDVFPIELSGRDDRRAPIFFAAVPDSKGFAFPGDQTVFSKALLACLRDKAGEAGEEDPSGAVPWNVTVSSLLEALETHFRDLPLDEKSDQEPTVGGLVKNALLCRLPGPPSVEVTITLDPAAACEFANLEVRNDQNAPVWSLPHPLPLTCQQRLPAGTYSITATFNPAHPSFQSGTRLLHALPPRRQSRLRV